MQKQIILIRVSSLLSKQGPPLGLAYLGAVLIAKGWQVRIIDAAPLEFSDKQILDEISWRKPIAVGFTSVTTEFPVVLKLVKKIKKKFGLPIIIGGPHASAVPRQVLSSPFFDFAILGEGEISFPLLLKTLIDRKIPLSKINGIGFKNGKKIILNPPQKLIDNLDTIPFPAHQLLPPFKKYKATPASYKHLPVAPIFTSRGCPFKCIYCDHSVFGWQIRLRSPENVVSEMEILVKDYGVRELRIWDDTFNFDSQRVVEICRLMIKKKLNLAWTCQGRVNFVNKKTLFWMKKAGCWQISYGIESGSEKILKLLKKGITREMVEKAVFLTREANIEVKGFFIVGLPKETKKDIEQTIRFSQKLPLDYATFSVATPFINTELYQMLNQKKKKSLFSKFSHFTTYQNPIVYFTDHLSKNEILDYQKQAYRQFYLRPSYWLRQLRAIKSPEELILKIKSLAVLALNI